MQCIAELLDLDYMVARGDENADGHILSADDYTQLNLVFNKGFKTLAELNKELAGAFLTRCLIYVNTVVQYFNEFTFF